MRTWDIFCSVVDNYGDAGVCWRLARQLALELGQVVRLWIDNPGSLQRLAHGLDSRLETQTLAQVEVRDWSGHLHATPADVVIEGFGARLPDSYLRAMAVRSTPSIWINLEYLSAEKWVDGYHGLPSVHPHLPLTKYFFFPGFTSATGGLLIERGLLAARDAFQQDRASEDAFWHSLNLEAPPAGTLSLSLFCYRNNALGELVRTLSSGVTPVVCVVSDELTISQLQTVTGTSIEVGVPTQIGQLAIWALPFLELDRYDQLLWACDINFVRGEDSFVRAQLAGRPLVWQAYPQDADAHLTKVAAFLDRYTAALDRATSDATQAFYQSWNGGSKVVARWQEFHSRRSTLEQHARNWAFHLAQGPNLALNLIAFCESRLK